MDKTIEFTILNAIYKKKRLNFFYRQGFKPLHLAIFLKELKISGLVSSNESGLFLSKLGHETLSLLKKEFSVSSKNNLPIIPAFGEKVDKISVNDIYLPSVDDVYLLD